MRLAGIGIGGFFVLLCIIILSFGYGENFASGLSCAPSTLEENFDLANVVFLGHVISKEYKTNPEIPKFQDSIVQFEVIEPFKGTAKKEITLTTREWFWSHNFEEGKDYVVFAIESGETLTDQLCSPTGPADLLDDLIDFNQLRLLASFPSPLKQIRDGTPYEKITCKVNLQLIFKKTDGSPACVKPKTAEKLIERGWGGPAPPTLHRFTTEAVLDIAQEFIISRPTFAFDGIEETLSLELVAIRESFPEQYVIEANFDSLHGGYGDRTNEVVIQVITPHTINLVVINGKVTSAILDGKWDELNQLQLPWTPTKGPSESPDTVSHGGDVVDYVSFVDNLRAIGAIVTPGGSISQPFFTVEGIVILVNGDDVQVFEYPTFIDAEFDARKVSPDGSSIGTSMPFWIGSPHFYLKENIIVLYVGDNLDTLSIIESVLGSQFAGR